VFGEVDATCIGATKLANLVVVGRPHGHGVPLSISRPVAVAVIKEANCPVAVVPSDYSE
jgi:nucleotide-binding universal stress UspA family protein